MLQVFAGASQDLRSPQLPYLKLDTWGCERQPANLSAILIENEMLRVTLTPQVSVSAAMRVHKDAVH